MFDKVKKLFFKGEEDVYTLDKTSITGDFFKTDSITFQKKNLKRKTTLKNFKLVLFKDFLFKHMFSLDKDDNFVVLCRYKYFNLIKTVIVYCKHKDNKNVTYSIEI
jgi:hypothetical protein